MTREEFIKRWRAEIVGLATIGRFMARVENMSDGGRFGQHTIDAVEGADVLLAELWRTAQPEGSSLDITSNVARWDAESKALDRRKTEGNGQAKRLPESNGHTRLATPPVNTHAIEFAANHEAY